MITVLVQCITDEMEQWFLEYLNIDNTKFFTKRHIVRMKFSNGYRNDRFTGSMRPMNGNFCQNGYEIVFTHKEDAVQFKLTFAEDINKFNSHNF